MTKNPRTLTITAAAIAAAVSFIAVAALAVGGRYEVAGTGYGSFVVVDTWTGSVSAYKREGGEVEEMEITSLDPGP